MSVRLRRNNDGRFRESAHGVNQNENSVSVSERIRHAFLPAAVSVQKIDLARLRGAVVSQRNHGSEPVVWSKVRREVEVAELFPKVRELHDASKSCPEIVSFRKFRGIREAMICRIPRTAENLFTAAAMPEIPGDGPTRSGKPSPAPVVFLAPDRCLGGR